MSESLLRLFVDRGALLEGHFLLSSGLHSPRYLQCALVLMDPPLATRLGAELADALRPLLKGAAPGAVVAESSWRRKWRAHSAAGASSPSDRTAS
jgi:orotate phosphoribosyltransferase